LSHLNWYKNCRALSESVTATHCWRVGWERRQHGAV
jgi:hypothetical protein